MDFIKFLIGLLIFGIIAVNGVLFMTDIDTNYGEFGANVTTDKFNTLEDRARNITDGLYGTSGKVKNETLGSVADADEEPWQATVKNSYTAIRFLKDSFGLVGDMANVLAIAIGFEEDNRFVNYISTALLIFISFSIIYLIFRYKP
jgi:hypothetical protein